MFDGVAYHQHNCEFEQGMMGYDQKESFWYWYYISYIYDNIIKLASLEKIFSCYPYISSSLYLLGALTVWKHILVLHRGIAAYGNSIWSDIRCILIAKIHNMVTGKLYKFPNTNRILWKIVRKSWVYK